MDDVNDELDFSGLISLNTGEEAVCGPEGCDTATQ